MQMRMFDQQGRVRERHLRLAGLRGAEKGERADRLLIRFLFPNDIKGTGFLVLEHPGADDERFLYLPALGRVRRIAGEEKQDSFVGSDFTYEDIGGRELTDYAYAIVDAATPRGPIPGQGVACLDARVARKGPHATYPRVVSTVLKDTFVVVAADNFNRRDEVVKTFEVRKLEQISGIWTALELAMRNRRDRTRTEMSRHQGRVQRRPQGGRLQPADARTGRAMIGRRRSAGPVDLPLAPVAHRHCRARRRSWRAPSADFTTLDNDMTAWFSKQDPVYVDYERFRQEFGGTRTLIVALEGDALFSPEGLELIRTVTREIERVDTVERVRASRPPTSSTALPETSAEDAGGIEVNPLVPDALDAATAARGEVARARRPADARRPGLRRRQGHRDHRLVRREPHRRGPRRRHPEDP